MNLKTLLAIFLTMTVVISCSDVNFRNAPSNDCVNADECVVTRDGETRTNYLKVPKANRQVDILFVVDNSGTMTDEQSKMAQRLSGFLSILNNANLDWRIAVATTDNYGVSSSSPYNPQDYRNGAIVPFLKSGSGSDYALQNGQKIFYITKDTPNNASLFLNTVQRPESLWCAQRGNCPSVVSGDERGIYTAIKNHNASFVRYSAQLHIVIISDEDERSNGGGFPNMGIESNDNPDTLTTLLVRLDKVAKVHSIVQVPGNFNYNNFDFEGCVASQVSNTSGQEYLGCHYIKAAVGSGGIVGSKDVGDYSSVLSTIATSIVANKIDKVDFACVPTEITFEAIDGYNYPNQYTSPQSITPNGQTSYTFNPALVEDMGMKVTWKCPRN